MKEEHNLSIQDSLRKHVRKLVCTHTHVIKHSHIHNTYSFHQCKSQEYYFGNHRLVNFQVISSLILLDLSFLQDHIERQFSGYTNDTQMTSRNSQQLRVLGSAQRMKAEGGLKQQRSERFYL
jgi:hypothetical protein